jgi:hypothetical protein
MLCILLMCRCTSQTTVAGGTSTSENGRIAGRTVTQTGQPASMVQVRLFPADYDPVKDAGAVPVDTTDILGRYSFTNVSSGLYNVVPVQIDDRTRSLVKGVTVAEDTVIVPADTLLRTGAIKVVLPGGIDEINGYFYVPGTGIFSWLVDNNGFIVLDSVPARVNLSVYYAVKGSSLAPQMIADSVIVLPGSVTTVAYPGWKYSKKLSLNTTSTGANVAGTVMDFPLLVRLTNSKFNFAQAKSGGQDLRFTKSDGTPLSYEIERWDSANAKAEIWVKVDTVYGNDSAHHIVMLWGASANSISNSAAVFDTANGFQGVWHLDENSGSLAHDATQNLYNGAMTATAAIKGIIGNGQEFDGSSSFVQMTGTADSKLNFPENGTYSVSAWVMKNTLDGNFHVIVSKHLYQYTLQERLDHNWEFHEFEDHIGFNATASPSSANVWTYIVGIRSGTNQYLYINGEIADSVILITTKDTVRATSNDLFIGRLPVFDGANSSWRFFSGEIDEVRISSVANSPDWIKLCYMNQKQDDVLVILK